MEHVGLCTDILKRPMVCDHCLNTLGQVALGHVWWWGQCNLWKMDRTSRWGLDCCMHSSLWECCTAASRISTSHCCQKHMLFSPAVLLGKHVSAAPTRCRSFSLTFSSMYQGQGTRDKLWHRAGEPVIRIMARAVTLSKPKPFGVGTCPQNMF